MIANITVSSFTAGVPEIYGWGLVTHAIDWLFTWILGRVWYGIRATGLLAFAKAPNFEAVVADALAVAVITSLFVAWVAATLMLTWRWCRNFPFIGALRSKRLALQASPRPTDTITAVAYGPQMCLVVNRLRFHREDILDLAGSPINFPPSIADIYCPLCWSATLALVPASSHELVMVYLTDLEKRWPHGPASGIYKHDCCPFAPPAQYQRESADVSVVAFHIRRCSEAAFAFTSPKDSKTTAGALKTATREGPRTKRHKNSNDLRDWVRGLNDPEEEYRLMEERAQQLDDEADEIAYGGSASWADNMDELDKRKSARQIRSMIGNLRYNKPKDKGTREGRRDPVEVAAAVMLHEHLQQAEACVKDHGKAPTFQQFALRETLTCLEQKRVAAAATLVCEEKEYRKVLAKQSDASKAEASLRYHQRCIADLQKQVPGVREAAQQVYVCDDETFMLCDPTAATAKIAALIQNSKADIEAHREVGRLMNEYCATTNQVRESKKKTEKKVQRMCESSIAGSAKTQLATASALLFYGDQVRGCVALPLGSVATKNAGSLLITHRHYYQSPGGIATDVPIPLGARVGYVTYPNQASVPLWGDVVSVICPPDQDVMYLYTNAAPSGLTKFSFGKPKVGTPVTIKTGVVDKRTPEGLVYVTWSEAIGTVRNVSPTAVHYDATTAHGDCGFPVYAADGTIIALHTLGNDAYDGKQRANAGERLATVAIPGRGTYKVPPFDPDPLGSQGRVVGPGKPDAFQDLDQFRMVEKMSYNGLRQDLNLSGLMPKHHWAKPSTLLNHKEARKYADVVEYTMDKGCYKKAIMAAMLYDGFDDFSTPFVAPTEASLRLILIKLDKQRSAGAIAGGLSAAQYITRLGDGDEELGTERLIDRVLRLYNIVSQPDLSPEDEDFVRYMLYWSVIGKKDGYKPKKLPVHDPPGSCRTIQAPCLELKLLWLACFGDNDSSWVHREDSWVHAGENADLPVTHKMVEVLRHARGCIAADLTAFDRYMSADMIAPFFMAYMSHFNPGVPDNLLRFLTQLTIFGPLLMSDGTVYMRTRGNPSGFMNTLRLNCVVHLCCLAYAIMRRSGLDDPMEVATIMRDEMKVQMCGDDSRHFALTERAFEIFDMSNNGRGFLEVWDVELPWEIKLEGFCVYPPDAQLTERALMTPPMVSRRFVVIQNRVFEPLYNLSRILKRLACSEKREPELEKALAMSAFSSLSLHIFWTAHGWFKSPVIDFLLREFGHYVTDDQIRSWAASAYKQMGRQKLPPPSPGVVRLWS